MKPLLTFLLAVAMFAVVALLPNSARAELPLPVEARAGDVVVRAVSGFDEIANRVAKDAASELAGIYEDLEGLARPPRIEIRLVDDTTDIAAAAPHPNVPHWAVGVAFSNLGIIVAARRRGGEILDIDNTVAHELAHLALGAALHGRAPRWLNEGFAYLHSSDWSFARFRTLVGMAWSNNVIDLWELDASFPEGEQQAHRAYAQSYDFVAFLARRGRHSDRDDDGNPWPFRRFLAAIAKGETVPEAAKLAYSARLIDLFGEWRRSLRSKYLLVPAEMFALAVWIFGALVLVIGYWRTKKRNRVKLALWDEEEAAADAARAIRLAQAATVEVSTGGGSSKDEDPPDVSETNDPSPDPTS